MMEGRPRKSMAIALIIDFVLVKNIIDKISL